MPGSEKGGKEKQGRDAPARSVLVEPNAMGIIVLRARFQ